MKSELPKNGDQAQRKLPPFTAIENEVINDERITHHDLLTYIAIAKFADVDREAFPAIRTIARVARIGTASVQNALKHLIVLGYVEKESRLETNGYITSNIYHIGVPSASTIVVAVGVSESDTPRCSMSESDTGCVGERQVTRSIELEPKERKEGKRAAPEPEPQNEIRPSDFFIGILAELKNKTGLDINWVRNKAVIPLMEELDEREKLTSQYLEYVEKKVGGSSGHFLTSLRDGDYEHEFFASPEEPKPDVPHTKIVSDEERVHVAEMLKRANDSSKNRYAKQAG